jgi:hypothetical protein
MPWTRALAATLMPSLTTVLGVPVSLASRPTGALTHRHPPLVRTVQSPGSDAPPEFSVDASLPVDRHGLSEVGDAMDAGSGDINYAPMQQSAALYPLFYCGNAEMGRQLVAAVGGTRTAPHASPPPAALAALPVNAD